MASEEIESGAWIEGRCLKIRHGNHLLMKFFGTFCLISACALIWAFSVQFPSRNLVLFWILVPPFILGMVAMGLGFWTWRMERDIDLESGTLSYGWKVLGKEKFDTVALDKISRVIVSELPTARHGIRYLVLCLPESKHDFLPIYLHEFPNNQERANAFAARVEEFLGLSENPRP